MYVVVIYPEAIHTFIFSFVEYFSPYVLQVGHLHPFGVDLQVENA